MSNKYIRKQLRKQSTPQEHVLWSLVRNKQLGYKFFRQYSIGPYIVDFCCPRARLIVELDGNYHNVKEVQFYDKERTDYLTHEGYQVIRFWNSEIKDLNRVLSFIKSKLP